MGDFFSGERYSSQLLRLRVCEPVIENGTVNVVVAADGEVDTATAPAMAACLTEASRRVAGSPPGCVIVDLSMVGFMGSAGVRALLNARTHTMRIVAPSRPVQRVLDISVPDEFAIYPSIDAAVLATPVRP